MRISDWSSDVCSSDLPFPRVLLEEALLGYPARTADERKRAAGDIGRDVRPHLGVIVRETRLGDSRVGPVEPVRMGEHGLGALLPAGACGRDFRLDHDVQCGLVLSQPAKRRVAQERKSTRLNYSH